MKELAEAFIVAAKLMPLENVEYERGEARLCLEEPIFAEQVAYLGDLFVEVIAHAYACAWLLAEMNPKAQPEYFDFIVPLWYRLQQECRSLNVFWS